MATEVPKDLGAGGKSLALSSDPSLKKMLFEACDDLAAMNTRMGAVQAILDAHLGRGGVHQAADVDNPVGSPVAGSVVAECLLIVNDAYDMMLAHMAEGASIHPGGADTVNVMSAANYPATDSATAWALLNEIKAKYELHRANNGGAWHTNPDATNTVGEPDATSWATFITLANAFKNTTGFNAHVVLTAGPTHGATDIAHVITATDCDTEETAAYLEANEIKTDLNAHIAHLGVHPTAGVANGTAAATTEATLFALLNGLKASQNTHMASADDHLDADTLVIAVADATGFEDVVPLAADIRAKFVEHQAKASYHNAVDPNVLGTGGAVTIGLTKEV